MPLCCWEVCTKRVRVSVLSFAHAWSFSLDSSSRVDWEVVLSSCCDSQPALCSGFLYCTLHTLGTASMTMLGKLHWDVSPNLWVVCFYLGNETFWGHVCNPNLCLNSEFSCVALRCWDHRVPVLAAKLNDMKNWATLKLLYLFVCLFGFP